MCIHMSARAGEYLYARACGVQESVSYPLKLELQVIGSS